MKNITYITLLALLTTGFLTTASALTEEEMAKKEKYFLKFDANQDRTLSESEYVEMTRVQFQKKGKKGHEEEGAKRFKRNDKDADGKVTFNEWLKNNSNK